MTAGRKPGCRKTGGRQVGSKNRVTESMRKDILTVYKRLGGVKWLLEWSRQNETEFVGKVLTRILPPTPREEPEPANPPLAAASMSDLEIARRIAFALAKAAYALEDQPTPKTVIESTPAEVVPELPPLDEVPITEPVYSIPKDYHAQEIVAGTHDKNIEDYQGSSAEQGERKRRL